MITYFSLVAVVVVAFLAAEWLFGREVVRVCREPGRRRGWKVAVGAVLAVDVVRLVAWGGWGVHFVLRYPDAVKGLSPESCLVLVPCALLASVVGAVGYLAALAMAVFGILFVRPVIVPLIPLLGVALVAPFVRGRCLWKLPGRFHWKAVLVVAVTYLPEMLAWPYLAMQ